MPTQRATPRPRRVELEELLQEEAPTSRRLCNCGDPSQQSYLHVQAGTGYCVERELAEQSPWRERNAHAVPVQVGVREKIMPTLTDAEAARLWRELSQLVNEGRQIRFEHEQMLQENPASASGRPMRVNTGVVFCQLYGLATERHLFPEQRAGMWRAAGDSFESALTASLALRERARRRFKDNAPPADRSDEEGTPPETPPIQPPEMPEPRPVNPGLWSRNQVVHWRSENGRRATDACPGCGHNAIDHSSNGPCGLCSCGSNNQAPAWADQIRTANRSGIQGRCANCGHTFGVHALQDMPGRIGVLQHVNCAHPGCTCSWERQ